MEFNELLLHHSNSTGTIVECYSQRRGGIGMKYTFYANGEILDGHSGLIDITRKRCNEKFVGKTFTVLYEIGDPENNEILISPNDFKRFQLPFPDTLEWVTPFTNQSPQFFNYETPAGH
jgi:hypothetical protein